MRLKIIFIAGIMGMAVISGIFQALTSPRGRTEKEEGIREGQKRAMKNA